MRHRRSWRRVAMAMVTLIPTLVGATINAPTASADPPAEHEWWNEFDGLGLTKIDTRIEGTGDYWKTFAIVHPQQHSSGCNAGSNLANQANEIADLGGSPKTQFSPGATANFCIEVNEGWAGSTQTDPEYFSTVTFKIRDDQGNTLPGSASITNPGNWHQMQSGSISVRMDAQPFNGQTDANLAPGWYEMYLEMTTTTECTPSACTSLGGGNVYNYGRGYFYVTPGYLWGAHPDGNSTSELTQEQNSSGLNKNMSLVRDYKPTWDTPSARVNTWAGQGKSVAWSVKPPAWSGSSSPWARAAADTAMIEDQIQSLQASANQTGGPSTMFYIPHHEPHDNTTDSPKGWDNGSSNRKCGSSTDPAGSSNPCAGTVAEYKAWVHQVRLVQQTACNATGGTTGTLGFPCNKVKIIYSAVVSNMTPGTNVGDDDLNRPDPADFDVFGGDAYNWGCFRKSSGTCTDSAHGGNNEWDSFEQLIDDPAEDDSLLDLAEAYSKPVIVTEIGSHPGCNGSETTNNCNGSNTVMFRSAWFTDMFRYLELDREANQYLLGWTYFHEHQTHDWRFIDTTAGGDVDNRGFTEYKAAVANALYLSTAAGYDMAIRTPTPAADYYSYSAATTSTYYVPAERYAQRRRTGASGWVPRQVGFDAWRHSATENRIKLTFQYFQEHHRRQSDDKMRTLEITADIPCINGQSPWGGDWFGQPGYNYSAWSTNIPAAALPHEDNWFFHSKNKNPLNGFANNGCGPDNVASVGIGIGDVSALTHGTEYYAIVGTYCETSCSSDTDVTIKVQAGTLHDINVPFFSKDNADCRWTTSELSSWNSNGNLRHEASWCNFVDYEATVVFAEQGLADTADTSVTYHWVNWLGNQGMEETGITGYTFWDSNGGTDYARNCSGDPAYDGSCYVRFSGGGNGGDSSLQQDEAYPGPVFSGSGENKTKYTAEAMLRCPTFNTGSCPITVAIWGIGINSTENTNMTASIPNDGDWYRCRVDDDHPSTSGHGWIYNHDTLRFEIYNTGPTGRYLDIDYTYLGGRHKELDPRVGVPFLDSDLGNVGSIEGSLPSTCYKAPLY